MHRCMSAKSVYKMPCLTYRSDAIYVRLLMGYSTYPSRFNELNYAYGFSVSYANQTDIQNENIFRFFLKTWFEQSNKKNTFAWLDISVAIHLIIIGAYI